MEETSVTVSRMAAEASRISLEETAVAATRMAAEASGISSMETSVAASSRCRVFAVSDIHTDYPANATWLTSALSAAVYSNDVLIVAGDVSHSIERLRTTLTSLKQVFREVFFTPGNHDLWLAAKGKDEFESSLAKLDGMLKLCEELGVHTQPKLVGGVWIVPLLSWYHSSWDVEPNIVEVEVLPTHMVAVDFFRCTWPTHLDPLTDSLAKHFDGLNDTAQLQHFLATRGQTPVISFSHFLPFQELLPEKRFLFYPNLPKMAGSEPLSSRVRALAPDVHVFGHTHFSWDAKVNGIRCIQAPLAYPSERHRVGGAVPFEIWNGSGFTPYPQPAYWSDLYRVQDRTPHNVTLAPWVRQHMGLTHQYGPIYGSGSK